MSLSGCSSQVNNKQIETDIKTTEKHETSPENRLKEDKANNNHILIFATINKEARVIGSMSEQEVSDNIILTNTYELINNQLALWFEVEVEDGKKGYLYRYINGDERHFYNNKSDKIRLKKKSGELITIDNHVNGEFDLTVEDDLTELGYYTLYITDSGERRSGWFINEKTGDSFYTKGEPILSTNKKRFIVANYDMEEGLEWNGIQIYSINDKEITLEYEEALFSWGPTNVKWVDDTHILLTKNVLEPNMVFLIVEAEMVLTNNSWVIREVDK